MKASEPRVCTRGASDASQFATQPELKQYFKSRNTPRQPVRVGGQLTLHSTFGPRFIPRQTGSGVIFDFGELRLSQNESSTTCEPTALAAGFGSPAFRARRPTPDTSGLFDLVTRSVSEGVLSSLAYASGYDLRHTLLRRRLNKQAASAFGSRFETEPKPTRSLSCFRQR